MAIRKAADIDVVKQGLYGTPAQVKIEDQHYTFFKDVLFGQPSKSTSEDHMGLDYESIGVSLAEEVLKGADPKRVNFRTGFNEKRIFGAYYDDEDQVDEGLCDNRVSMQEPIDKPWSLEDRLTYLLADKRDKISRSHDITFNKLCADAVLSGQFSVCNGGIQTFPVASALLSVSGANLSTAPVAALNAGIKAILKHKGAKPAMLLLNPDDAVTICESAAFQAICNKEIRRGNEVFYKALDENGAGWCGTINLPGIGTIDVISVYDAYVDKNNNNAWTYLLPQGKAILCPRTVGYKGFCGVFVDNGLYTGKEGVEHGTHIWREEGPLPYTTHVQVQSAPVPMLTAIDRYCVFTNVA